MLTKVRFILVFVSLSICLCLMSSTYSRYVADATGNIDVVFAKWQILVNNFDITSTSNSTIDFVPVMESTDHIADNVIAPSSKGYFDIDIDPTNVDVSFKYTINLGIENEDIPDLIITKYAIIPASYIDGEHLDFIILSGNSITNTMLYDKNISSFRFEPFMIRVYFEWYEGENELMNDYNDSLIGHLAATEDITIKLTANILFEQVIE